MNNTLIGDADMAGETNPLNWSDGAVSMKNLGMRLPPFKVMPFVMLSLTSSSILAISSWDAEEVGRTYAQAKACVEAMRSKHDWRLNRALKDLVNSTEEEIEDSPQYAKKVDRGYKDGLSYFRSQNKDEQKQTCYGLVGE